MKKCYLVLVLVATLAISFASCSDSDDHNYVELNLNDFDLSGGIEVTGGKYWEKTYLDGTNLTSGIYKFSHTATLSPYGNSFSGFVASNVANNSDHGNDWYPDHQFAAMTKGGVSGEGKPYLVNYGWGLTYNAEMSFPLEGKTFDESKFTSWVKIENSADTYKASRVSITNTSLAYYSLLNGDGYGKVFENGDYFKISIYGVDKDMKITSPVTAYLADYRNGKKMILDKWQTVSISSLGEVEYIFFTLESTDNDQYGMKTPAYFCMDKLVVDKID